jgi:hypothetical protein
MRTQIDIRLKGGHRMNNNKNKNKNKSSLKAH